MSQKILLIEDNLEVRENTAEILELSNYDVETAENGKIGVEMAKSLLPDLIICDIMMPELDGYGVLHILSKDPATHNIPFIFLTAKAEKSDFRKGMNLGADDYLVKPFDETDLLEAIDVRFKRNEQFKAQFAKDEEGLDQFMENARGLSGLEALTNERKTRTFKKKETIYHEGDYPNTLCFICKGKVKTYKMNEAGKEYITGLYKEGDFLGYVALLEGKNHTDSATLLEDGEVNLIPKDDFFKLLYNNRDVASKFIKMLSDNVEEKEERLLQLAYDSIRMRVAEALVLLKNRYQESEEQFSMSVSRNDLASLVGTAPESVIRTLSDFKEEGFIGIKGSNITILNPEGLENLKY
jgi:CheY-like chemotaxis protein/CRP-like cAMP-binding protein